MDLVESGGIFITGTIRYPSGENGWDTGCTVPYPVDRTVCGSSVWVSLEHSLSWMSDSEMEAVLSKELGDMEGRDVSGAMEALVNADAVCFYGDSSVVAEEGIVSFVYAYLLDL